jgi:hypothetical protein
MDHNKDHDQDPESTVVPVNDDALEAVTGGFDIDYERDKQLQSHIDHVIAIYKS